jgi:transcriptional regulator with XRE-family HTH domain
VPPFGIPLYGSPKGGIRVVNHRLRRCREQRGWSQQEVGDLLGLTRAAVSLFERGERQVSPEWKIAIARTLGVRVADIFDPPPKPEPRP